MIDINKIYNENCLDTMHRMPNSFINATITSPPYDNLRKYKGFDFPFEDIVKELYHITMDGGIVVWVVGDSTINGSESGTSFKQALYFMQCGFNLHDTMIYQKQNYIPLTHNRYEQSFEYMFVFSKGKPKTFNPLKIPTKTGGTEYNLKRKGYCASIKEGAQRRRDQIVKTNAEKIKPNIFTYTCGSIRVNHPAPFPEKLAEDHILSWSNEGDLVYDPFTGSGTTPKMAILNKRNYIGSEMAVEYMPIINERIENIVAINKLF